MIDEPEPVTLPISHELDLHQFRPNEVGELLREYFYQCRQRKIHMVRVVHGKGTGSLRIGVHAALEKIPGILDWTWPVHEQHGGWGATFVRLSCIDCEQH
jgi:DNA-nicking Smr family endonuclease